MSLIKTTEETKTEQIHIGKNNRPIKVTQIKKEGKTSYVVTPLTVQESKDYESKHPEIIPGRHDKDKNDFDPMYIPLNL